MQKKEFHVRKSLVQYFYLSPMHCDSNRVLEVLDFHTHDGAPLGLGYLKPGHTNQMWAFVPCGDGFYEVLSKHTCKVLDDSVSSAHPSGLVFQYTRHGGANQQWKVKQANAVDRVQLFPRCNTAFVLDVSNQSTDRYAHMVLWHDWKGPNQIWRLMQA